MAAHRAGVKTILAPENNKKDLEDLPDFVKEDLEFKFVKHMDDVLEEALIIPPSRSSVKKVPQTPPPAFA